MIKLLLILSFLVFLFIFRHGLIPIAVGIAIAYVLDPYVTWLERKLPIKRGFCVAVAYLSALLSLALLVWSFADMITGKLNSPSLRQSLVSIQSYYLTYEESITPILGFSIKDIDSADLMARGGKILLNLFLGSVAGAYLLSDKAFFLRLCNKALHLLLPQKPHGIIRELFFEINDVVSAFLRGLFIDSVIVAFLSALVLVILGVDFAVFLGCFAGIANIIPYFGPLLGMIPALLSALAGGGLTKAIMAAAALFAVQQLESDVIYPRIIGKSTGLHPFFILVAVTIAGTVGGLLWMILAVPIAGILRVLISKWAQSQ